MRTIKINHQDGRVFYGAMMLAGVFSNPEHIGVKLDEKLQMTDVHGDPGEWDCFTFNPKTGAVVIASGSPGEVETDLFMIDSGDLPRADEFFTLQSLRSQL